jgi:hypothetical protein
VKRTTEAKAAVMSISRPLRGLVVVIGKVPALKCWAITSRRLRRLHSSMRFQDRL